MESVGPWDHLWITAMRAAWDDAGPFENLGVGGFSLFDKFFVVERLGIASIGKPEALGRVVAPSETVGTGMTRLCRVKSLPSAA
jgi:hypothetical protein